MAEALAHGKAQVLGVHVVLEIDEGLGFRTRHMPERREERIGFLANCRPFETGRRPAERFHNGRGLARTVIKTFREAIVPRRSPHHDEPRADIRRHERLKRLRPDRLAAALAGKMDDRAPAAGHGDRVTGDQLFEAAAIGDDSTHTMAPLRIDDRAAAQKADTGRRDIVGCRTAVDQRRDFDAPRRQIARRAITGCTIGENRDGFSRRDAEPVGIGADRACRQDARPVIAAEDQRPFLGAGREDRVFRHDAPHPLDGLCSIDNGDIFLDPFDRAENIVVVPAEHRGARQERDIGVALQFLDHAAGENIGRLAADRRRLGKQRTAENEILLGKNDAQTRAGRHQRCGKPRRTGAYDEQVAMRPALLIAVGIARQVGPAETGGATDQWLIDLFPEGRWPHEGLVVEPGRKKPRHQVVHGADIIGKARPAVLAAGLQTVIEFGDRRPGIGIAPRTAADRHQPVRLGGTCGHDATRAMIFEAAADKQRVIGKQC